MLTKFITEVTTSFNPFKRPGRTCRVFLAHLPANARSTMKITTKILPRDSQDLSLLKLKFSRLPCITCFCNSLHHDLTSHERSLLTVNFLRGWDGNAARCREDVYQRPDGRSGQTLTYPQTTSRSGWKLNNLSFAIFDPRAGAPSEHHVDDDCMLSAVCYRLSSIFTTDLLFEKTHAG